MITVGLQKILLTLLIMAALLRGARFHCHFGVGWANFPENRRKTNTRFTNSGYTKYTEVCRLETENFDEKKKASKSAQYFPELKLKICCLKIYLFNKF